MTIVSNSSPIISFIRIGELHLLKELYNEIIVPGMVYKELTVKNKTGSEEIAKNKWIRIAEIEDKLAASILQQSLDKGESEAIILTREINADALLIDEKAARKYLKMLDIEFIGTLGILVLMRQVGIINDTKSYVDKLISKGFRISNQLYKKLIST